MKKAILFSLVGFSLMSCATLTRGTTDTLVIESDPANADVYLSNGLSCKTPCALKLKRNESVNVEISKKGYETVKVNVVPQISGSGSAGMAGNVILGGIIGAAVDAGSGAMYDLKPNPIQVKLQKLEEFMVESEKKIKDN